MYRYENFTGGPWQLSVATHAAPRSQQLSLGGFRIVPRDVALEPGYNNESQAIGLARGMEGKIHWSRVVRVGGPLAKRRAEQPVGGKCVLCPSDDSRVGQPSDFQMLDWAAECLHDLEARCGFHVVTGQDLGHGVMSDGTTQSLLYLNSRFPGSVTADTSKPTGEGNFHVLKGMLAAFDIPLTGARVGLIGCGHIGSHVLDRAIAGGAKVVAMDASEARRMESQRRGVTVLAPDAKSRLLSMPLDAIVVNANKRSLDTDAITRIIANEDVRVVCGSENEAMPDPTDADRLRRAKKAYFPTEFGGMMGYLTAVEEYYHHLDGTTFELSPMLEASAALSPIAERITRRMIESGFDLAFADAAGAESD